jgi:hypothetical protein
MRIALE